MADVYHIQSGLDDGEWAEDGQFENGSFNILVASNNGGTSGFFRFRLDVPKGAEIQSASIGVIDQSSLGIVHGYVQLGYVDDAPQPMTANDLITMDKTATVAWSPIPTGFGIRHWSPDISALIQSVIDRSGWDVSQHVIVLIAWSSGSGFRRVRSYEYDPDDAAILQVEWRIPPPSVDATITTDLVLDATATAARGATEAVIGTDLVLDAAATAGVVEPLATLTADLVLDTAATAHSPAAGFAWVAPPENA